MSLISDPSSLAPPTVAQGLADGRIGDLWRTLTNLLPRGRQDSRVIGLVGICLILLIGTLSWFVLKQNRDVALTAAKNHVEQLSKTVAHQLIATLSTIDNALQYVGSDIRKTGSPERFAELGEAGQLPTAGVSHFSFVDVDGQVTTDSPSHGKPRPKFNAKDREFFRVHLDRVVEETFVSRPILSRVTGAMVVPVSRSVRRTNGELIGVLVVLMELDSLDQVWSDVGMNPTDKISLIGADGHVWLSWPRSSSAPATEKGPATGSTDRLVSSQALSNWPLKVAADINYQVLEQETAPARNAIVASTLGASLLVALFTLMLSRRTRQAAEERDTATRMRAHLLAAIDAVPVEFIEYDSERRASLVNQAARRSSPWRVPPPDTGTTVEAVMLAHATHFATPETLDQWQAWARQGISDYERGGVSELRRPDGQWRRSYVTALPDGGQIVVRVDVTEMKEREELLAAEMERLNSVFQSTGAVIVMLDREGCVVLANQPALDLHGTTGPEIAGRHHGELKFSGLEPAVIERWHAEALTERLQPVEFECSIAGANGEKQLLRFTANPVQDEAGRLRYIVLIGVDDTQRRMAEVRLFDASRLANLGEMATGIAHEINQPLAVIRLAADSVREEMNMPEAEAIPADMAELFRLKLDRIVAQTDRASGIIKDLRTVARKPVNNLQPFDLAEATRVGADLLREQLKLARIEFTLDVPPSGPLVLGEASRIQQVVINLVLNARDALNEHAGSSSTERVGRIEVRVATDPATGSALLTVEDDGPGIPAKVLPRLFEPFFTTKPVSKGTGLGLSISSEIVRRMGGEISAENRDEGGARFRIVLPPTLPAIPVPETRA